MPETDILQTLIQLASEITVNAILFFMWHIERQRNEKERMRFENILALLMEDWKRQRDDEREDDTIAKRLNAQATKNGTGL